MRPARSAGLVLCLLAAACSHQPGPEPPACDAKDLAPPAACGGGGDGAFQEACWVDCNGRVYPVSHGEGLLDLPDHRFYGLFLRPAPAAPPPAGVQAFVGRNSTRMPGPWCCAERDRSNEVPVELAATADGAMFVRMRRQMDGPVQVVVQLSFDASSGYVFRAYVGGEPVFSPP